MRIGVIQTKASFDELNEEMTIFERAGCERIVLIDPTKRRRDMIAIIIKRLSPGDALVAWNLDAVASSLPSLIDLVLALDAQDIGFKSLQEDIDTSAPDWNTAKEILVRLQRFSQKLEIGSRASS